MPRDRPSPPPFEPAELERSLDRYLTAGLVFMALLIAGFAVYRVREPTLRADAAVQQQRTYQVLGTELFALSQKCPHLGCRVPFCDTSGRFECPCHGSKYDLGGEWIEGPAPRGMDRFDLSLQDGNLVVDPTKVISGPERGADQFLQPAKGPACAPKA